MTRPKHPRKELEALLVDVEDQEWRVERKKGAAYYKTYCPCKQHKETVHITPSDPNYEKNKRKQFERTPCWRKETGEDVETPGHDDVQK